MKIFFENMMFERNNNFINKCMIFKKYIYVK